MVSNSHAEKSKRAYLIIQNLIAEMQAGDALKVVDVEHIMMVKFGFGSTFVNRQLEKFEERGIIKIENKEISRC